MAGERSCLNSGLPSAQSCAEGGDIEAIWTCRALPLRSTGGPGLLTRVLETEEGALANHDWPALQRHQKVGRREWSWEHEGGRLCWGGAGPAQGRQAGLEEHSFGRLGSDRALI